MWFIFRCITLNILDVFFLFLSFHIPHRSGPLVSIVSIGMLCRLVLSFFLRPKCSSVMCVYLYNFLLFPLIVFNSWKLRAAQPPLPLPLPELQTYCDYIEKSILCKNGCDPTVKLCFISSIFFCKHNNVCASNFFLLSHPMEWHAYFIQMHVCRVLSVPFFRSV